MPKPSQVPVLWPTSWFEIPPKVAPRDGPWAPPPEFVSKAVDQPVHHPWKGWIHRPGQKQPSPGRAQHSTAQSTAQHHSSSHATVPFDPAFHSLICSSHCLSIHRRSPPGHGGCRPLAHSRLGRLSCLSTAPLRADPAGLVAARPPDRSTPQHRLAPSRHAACRARPR